MEIRRIADALVRSSTTSPIPRYLLPTTRCHSLRQTRQISSSSSNAAIKSSVTTSSTPAKQPTLPNPTQNLGSALDWIKAGPGGNSTSKFKSPSAQAANRASSPFADRNTPSGSSSTNPAPNNPFRPQNSHEDLLSAIAMRDFASATDPFAGNADPFSPLTSQLPPMPKPVSVPLRLNPSTGRVVNVGQGIDVARGFRLLEQSCGRNGVRRDFHKQQFHERGGIKRKRLRRERWRKKFLVGFRATVNRVKELKRQGW